MVDDFVALVGDLERVDRCHTARLKSEAGMARARGKVARGRRRGRQLERGVDEISAVRSRDGRGSAGVECSWGVVSP